jgi:hypothetical protein
MEITRITTIQAPWPVYRERAHGQIAEQGERQVSARPLEEEALPEQTMQRIIARTCDRQHGDGGWMERHQIAEHAGASASDESGSSRRRRTQPSGK